MNKPIDAETTYRVRTTDATSTVVHTEVGPAYAALHCEVQATAMNSAGTVRGMFVRHASFGWAAGTLSKVGATLDVATIRDAGAITWDVGIVASGATVLVGIIGQAATTINWLIKVKMLGNISRNDSGTSTATSATTLTDSGKSWATNEWATGYVVSLSSRGRIVSNTGTVLTVASWVGGTPASGNPYTVDTEPQA